MKTLFQTMRSFQRLHKMVKAVEIASAMLIVGFWIAPLTFNIYADCGQLLLLILIGMLLSVGVFTTSCILEDKVERERIDAENAYEDMCSDYIDRQC